MFEIGTDQAAGLRAAAHHHEAVMISVASPAQPARAYEMLCHLAMGLRHLGHLPVIIDGTAPEATARHEQNGSHLGLQHVLTDASISGLGHPCDGHEWLVMPAATGLRTLQQTARAAGGAVALERLLAPFAAGTVLLVFAPAPELAPLTRGLQARVLVPVLPWPQAAIDAYGAVKLLHLAGAQPVLAPMDAGDAEVPLEQVVAGVNACASRHLGLAPERWNPPVWATAVQEFALARPLRQDTLHGLHVPRHAGLASPFGDAASSFWS